MILMIFMILRLQMFFGTGQLKNQYYHNNKISYSYSNHI